MQLGREKHRLGERRRVADQDSSKLVFAPQVGPLRLLKCHHKHQHDCGLHQVPWKRPDRSSASRAQRFARRFVLVSARPIS